MNKNSYQFNYSQDIVHLQTKFSLFNRVSNILFAVSFDHGFNQETMQQAVQLTVDRNDCLRLTFIKEGKQIRQYFEPKRIVESIPSYRFDTYQKMEAFIKRFRRNAVNIFKGKAADFVFVTDPSGKQQMFVKISHYAADTYGIGIIVNDLRYTMHLELLRNFLHQPENSKHCLRRMLIIEPTLLLWRRTGSSLRSTMSKDILSVLHIVESTEAIATDG